LGQIGSTHAGHAHISEQYLNLGADLQDLQRAMTIVGVEHLTAEFLKHLCGADLGHIIDREHGKSAHRSNSQRNAYDGAGRPTHQSVARPSPRQKEESDPSR